MASSSRNYVIKSVHIYHDMGKVHKSLSPWVSYLTFPNQSFLTCNTEVNNNTNITKLMYISFVFKYSSFFPFSPNTASLKKRKQE